MRLKNTFVQGKMNKDIDERLLPKGQYPHAENVRVINTDASDIGAIENVMGNEQLTSFVLTNAKTIGAFSDDSNQKLYWFTTSDEKDLVVEYDTVNAQTNILLESSNPDGVLNFSRNNLITGISKIINGDSDKDLLVWTDDRNPPRIINIERAKTYGADGFVEDDISLIKKPPRNAPRTSLTFTSSTLENNIEDRFLSFAYRYRYLDGEYSAISPFTSYNFAPNEFELDYQTMENNGMVNSFNAVKIDFNTGSKRVTDIQLLFKESNSNSVSVIETFDKNFENWGDDETQSFVFSNSKRYTFLPEDELFRTFDNVPKLAKAMELIGNRVVFGNYTEGYDLVNIFGEEVNVDFNLSLLSKDLTGTELPVTLSSTGSGNDTLTFDLGSNPLNQGTRINLDVRLQEITYSDGSYVNGFDFILNEDYADAAALAASPDFILFVETIMTNTFLQGYTATPPPDSELFSNTTFSVVGSTATTISITTPSLTYRIDNTPADTTDNDFTDEVSNWIFLPTSRVFYREVAIDTSLKTNRSYEVGIIYLDEYGRATTVLTDAENTIYVPQAFSLNQNKIVVNVNHNPPAWADRYKFVVKQNKGEYQTIYTSIFYEDGLFRWVKLEGANKDKVKEGDTLIVKSDLSGFVDEVTRVRVIEVSTQQEDFLEGNVDENGTEIKEDAGLYMKIKPTNFDMNFNNNTFLNYDKYRAVRSGRPVVFMGSDTGAFGIPQGGTLAGFFDPNTNLYVDYEIVAGSRIHVKFRNYESDGYNEIYEKDFIVQSTYPNFQDWWEAEVVDLGVNEPFFDVQFQRNADNSLWMRVEGAESGARFERSKLSCQIDIVLVEGILIFETEPEDSDVEIYYETEQTFDIVDGFHTGNTQDQTAVIPTAIVELDFFNCYVQGNGAESYRVRDAFNENYLNIDLRPTTTSVEGFKEVRRYADLTYSAVYNENTNVNGLNEFNLARANFKEDIDKRYGFIQKLFARDTDLVVFQEDKVSKVLFGKDLLMNADGTSNVSSIEDVLGQQIAYTGEYGISRNPESFTFDGFHVYFTDAKRGAVMRLSRDGLNEISANGMRQWFKDRFKDSIDNKKIGGFDPYHDQYVLHPTNESISLPVSVTCQDTVIRNDFSGDLVITMDFGVQIGTAGFSYSSNGVPVKYDIEWNGQTFTTGFVGDPAFNSDLADLGLPPVVGAGNGTFSFNKNVSIPSTATITVTAPLCDTNFEIGGNCIVAPELTVVSVVLNDEFDNGLTMSSRYKWSNPTYNSPFTNFNSVFEEGELDIYNTEIGMEGTSQIPINGSSVRIESFNGFNQTAEFLEENQLGYLVSDTLYTEAEVQDLVDAATFPTANELELPNGDKLVSVDFTFSRVAEQYLYLIWDYRNPALAINQDTKIRIYFDSSGSMNSTLAPLQEMASTLLKDRLLPLYNNDSALYDSSVSVISQSDERTMDMLNLNGDTPDGNVVVLVFQDESSPYGVGSAGSAICPRENAFDVDLSALRNRLVTFDPDYYRGVVFQVVGVQAFGDLISAVQNGTDCYAGANGLSDRFEFNYKYNITDGGTPTYYLNQIVTALLELGYVL